MSNLNALPKVVRITLLIRTAYQITCVALSKLKLSSSQYFSTLLPQAAAMIQVSTLLQPHRTGCEFRPGQFHSVSAEPRL